MSGQSTQPETDNHDDFPDNATAQDASQQATAATDEGSAPVGEAVTEGQLIAELETERLRQDEEIKSLKDRVLRTAAEMENLRKRTEKEKADSAKYAITKFSMDVVTIGDNLQRAMDAAGSPDDMSEDVKGLYDGLQLTAQELEKSLAKNGVKRIEALGNLFDPHLHQAIMENPDPSVTSGTILQVFQEGYTIGERVLRPSMVVVARGGPKIVKEAADTETAQPTKPARAEPDPEPITPDDDPNA